MIRIPPEDLIFIGFLGKGGCGKVNLEESKTLGKVAVKYTLFGENEATFEEFLNEAKILLELNSPNIIRFFGTTRKIEGECIVMEYAENGTLFQFFQSLRKKKIESTFSWDKRYEIVQDITRGLLLMHSRGVLHRDMKSMNILLDHDFRAKISDFGLSKIKNKSQTRSFSLSVENISGGSLLWKAPETFSIANPYTDKADIYSLGIIFWEIATCQVPYDEFDVHTIESSVKRGERLGIPLTCPIEFKDLIELCWSHDPKQRPSAADVFDQVSRIIADCSKTTKRKEMEHKIRIEEQKKNAEEEEKRRKQELEDILNGKWNLIKAPDFEGNIFKAAAKGKLTSIIYLLANGTNVNEKYLFEQNGDEPWMKESTALHFSAFNGHLSVVEYLVSQQADLYSHSNNVDVSMLIRLLFI